MSSPVPSTRVPIGYRAKRIPIQQPLLPRYLLPLRARSARHPRPVRHTPCLPGSYGFLVVSGKCCAPGAKPLHRCLQSGHCPTCEQTGPPGVRDAWHQLLNLVSVRSFVRGAPPAPLATILLLSRSGYVVETTGRYCGRDPWACLHPNTRPVARRSSPVCTSMWHSDLTTPPPRFMPGDSYNVSRCWAGSSPALDLTPRLSPRRRPHALPTPGPRTPHLRATPLNADVKPVLSNPCPLLMLTLGSLSILE